MKEASLNIYYQKDFSVEKLLFLRDFGIRILSPETLDSIFPERIPEESRQCKNCNYIYNEMEGVQNFFRHCLTRCHIKNVMLLFSVLTINYPFSVFDR